MAELMAAAGFTHGGFYKHFNSKADLMAEATACGISQTAATNESLDLTGFVERYVSREHRDARGVGCTMAALGGDAARQPEAVKANFAAGIENLLTSLERDNPLLGDGDHQKARAKAIDLLAQAVGAVVLSRACPDDSSLADEILEVSRAEILASITNQLQAGEY